MEFSIQNKQRFVTAGELKALLEKLHPDTPVWVCTDFGFFHAAADLSYACLDNGQYAIYPDDDEEIACLEHRYAEYENWQQAYIDF